MRGSEWDNIKNQPKFFWIRKTLAPLAVSADDYSLRYTHLED
jgi:hypothetical protein